MPTQLYACNPDRVAALLAELTRAWPKAQHREITPYWVATEHVPIDAAHTSAPMPAIAFCTQVLPAPRALQAASINAWADLLTTELMKALTAGTAGWRLHLLAAPDGTVPPRRVVLIAEGVTERLKKRQRQLLRRQTHDMAQPWGADEVLVQVAFLTPDSGYVSFCDARSRHIWGRTLSRFPAGIAPVQEDREPPARAYLKLLEALQHLGRRPEVDEICVDLGAAPGSWTYVALAANADVIAVDRNDVRDDMLANPRLSMVKGDAFKYQPNTPVDWLLCDVIAFPDRIIALLDAWLTAGLCRFFVVTLKFRGDADYIQVEHCKAVLEKHGAQYGMRQLVHNKNEVTVYGEARRR